jgi:hypothetical protein
MEKYERFQLVELVSASNEIKLFEDSQPSSG